MGGAQPLAVTLNGGVCLVVDVSRWRLRAAGGDTATWTSCAVDLDDAVERCLRGEGAPARPLSVGLVGNCAAVLPELLRRGVEIDIVTDQTSAHDPLAYLPDGVDVDDWDDYARSQARGVHRPGAGVDGPARRGDGRVPGRGRRGVRLRQLDPRRGPPGRLRPGVRLPRLRARLHPAAVLRGQGPVPVGGAVRATRPTSRRPTTPCSTCSPTTTTCTAGSAPRRSRWRSRGCRPGSAGSATASATGPGCGSTSWSPSGEVSAPIVIGRDHLDAGSVASPYRETEAMADGSDAIADWPLLNALVNTRIRGDLGVDPPRRRRRHRAARSTPGRSRVADGTALAAEKLARVLANDPAMGVLRHVDAGLPTQADAGRGRGEWRPRPDADAPTRIPPTALQQGGPAARGAHCESTHLRRRRDGRFDRMWADLAGSGGIRHRRLPPLRLDPRGRRPARVVRRRGGRRAGWTSSTDRAGNQWAWWGDPGRATAPGVVARLPPRLGARRRRVRRPARRRVRASPRSTRCGRGGFAPARPVGVAVLRRRGGRPVRRRLRRLAADHRRAGRRPGPRR